MPHSTTSPPSSPPAVATASRSEIVIRHDGALPYWLVNVPQSEWPVQCPDFLLNQSQKNVRCLSMPDEKYTKQTWDVVKDIISRNEIDRFQRIPSDLRKYLEYSAYLKQEYGSTVKFVLKERLGWGEAGAKPKGSKPFEHDGDIKILYNDWPYGVDKDIIHLVVWTKFSFEDDPETNDLTPKAREEIDDYVQKTFCSRIPAKNIRWFKNWNSLKSVKAIEHFHVMLYQPDMAFIKEITNGDVPLAEKV